MRRVSSLNCSNRICFLFLYLGGEGVCLLFLCPRILINLVPHNQMAECLQKGHEIITIIIVVVIFIRN